MPLFRMTAEEAVANRRSNASAYWGYRTSPNRVEPIAMPAFEVPFTLRTGEDIFTIGSCFARHIEDELQARGFEIPMRTLMARPEFQDVPFSALNNYGTPSIFNELAWALDPARPFDVDRHIVEIEPCGF